MTRTFKVETIIEKICCDLCGIECIHKDDTPLDKEIVTTHRFVYVCPKCGSEIYTNIRYPRAVSFKETEIIDEESKQEKKEFNTEEFEIENL